MRQLSRKRIRMALRVLAWLERPKKHGADLEYMDAVSEARYAAMGTRSPVEPPISRGFVCSSQNMEEAF